LIDVEAGSPAAAAGSASTRAVPPLRDAKKVPVPFCSVKRWRFVPAPSIVRTVHDCARADSAVVASARIVSPDDASSASPLWSPASWTLWPSRKAGAAAETPEIPSITNVVTDFAGTVSVAVRVVASTATL